MSSKLVTRRLPNDLADAARDYARTHGVSLSEVWQAALLTVLQRYTGQTDLVIGSGTAVLRSDLSGGPSFADVVARCHTTADTDAPLRIRLPRAGGELAVTVGPVDLSVEYLPYLVDTGSIDRLLDQLTAALAGGLAAPGGAVAEIDILPPAERRLVLHAWNPPPTPRTPGLLHQVTAGHDPDRVAIRFHGTELTYGELERRSNQMAHALREYGVGTGHVVGLLLDRGLHLPVAQIAVMKAGAAWLPLDPQHPPTRLGFLAGDAGARLVLTTAGLADLAAAATPGTSRWCLDDPREHARIDRYPDTPPDVDVRPDDPAYLLYTSGSTGTPKGVLVPHHSAHSYCQTAVELFRITPADRVVQASNPAFDASIFDCYATLLAGATLIGAPFESIAGPASFTDLIRSERVTLSFIPPAVLALLDPDDFAHSALRGIFSAGEALPPEQASRWSRPGLELHNSYGPTETTVVVTDYLCTDEPLSGPTPIGTALPNHRAYALDERLRPVPIGVTGQLFIAGTGVTYGYHDRPGLTAERFLPDPYAQLSGERMYDTGDIVRWRADGVLEFLGRRDRQVQLRGQRVELGEIEHTLTQHPDVRQCAVLLHDGTQLVAYLAGEPDLAELREYLAQRLPTYMIPTTLVTLPELPLTPNGKLDTARLPDPAPAATDYVAPRTEAERWLAANWRDLIGVDRIGLSDDFFDLGGNSLHVTQLVARVRDELNLRLTPQQLFANPILKQVAARLDEAGPGEVDTPIVTVPRDGSLVCAYQQEGLWFQHQLDPSSAAYHIGLELRLRGVLDPAALARALHALVVRHEALRTRFVAEDGRPRQVIDPPPARRPLSVLDLTIDRVDGWVADELRRPFDLTAGPLFRTPLARIAPDEHVLMLVLHHIVADGWSARVLAGELSRLYTAQVSNTDAALAPLRIQPADYAAWQRGRLDGAELHRQLDHWRTTLADLPTVNFPTDRPRPARPTGAGGTLRRRLPRDLAEIARGYARKHRVSFLAVAQAALLTVLHRYTGQTDLPIGSIFSGRTRADLEPLVGFFANTLVLRTDVTDDPSFADLIGRCHHTVLDATAHQDAPFALVVDALQPERTAGRNPLFQISLSLQPPGATIGGLTLDQATAEAVDVGTGFARFDLAIAIIEALDGRLDLQVEYSSELFDADRVVRLLDHLTAALAGGLADPDGTVADIDILPPTEREQVLHAWNPPPTPRTPGLLHQVTAGHDPDRVAIRFHGTELTYSQLERRSNQLAHALRDNGIGTGHIVGLLLDRGLHLPIAQLAVMKAGAAWTILDAQHPTARLAMQTVDAGATLVLTTADLADLAPVGAPRTHIEDLGSASPDTPPEVDVRPDDPAYLLYTSGSTGIPKGILVSHRSAYEHCVNAVELYAMSPADRVAQVSNPAFDMSVCDCYATLLAGATMVGIARDTLADPGAFTAMLRQERITLTYVPPALLALLDPGRLVGSALRALISAGEALPGEQANRWARPGLVLHNSYGPTETTIVCTDYRCPPMTPLAGPVPIGTALPNRRAYVLDGRRRPAPIGVAGQLFIAGAGVSYGYRGRPALTAERFQADPYGDGPGQRMYATGDLVRWRADGVLEFLGRGDRQVKLRGQRVELGEIEHALLQHPHIRQTAVILRDNVLCGYVVGEANLDEARQFLADRLPTYMIPTSYVALPELPLTPNGKLDLARLPDPAPPAAEYVAPRTPTERWLADTWREILDVNRVGAGDNFFDLGGNSLHATQLVARVRDRLDIELSPRDLFSSPTLDQLARRVDEIGAASVGGPGPALDNEIAELERRVAEQADLERLLAERAEMERLLAEKRAAKQRRAESRRIVPVPRDGSLVCTLQQEGLWFEHQLDPSSTVYHIAFALRLRGALDVPALGRALHALVVRHESLRTRFVDEGGVPRQVIEPPPDSLRLPVVGLADKDVEEWVAAEIRRPMDLAAGRLLRASLARLAGDEHVLVLVVHHIVADGWSARILAGELTQLYAAESGVPRAPLPELPVQPADHAAWQRGWLDGGELDRQLGFWRETLSDLPTVDFPTDRPRPVDPTGAGAAQWRRLPHELAAAAREFARARRVSFLAVSQAALLTVLHRYTDQTDLPIGSIFSGRTRADTEAMVGYFVNALVLRTRLDGNPSFAELVDRCHETVLAATAHQDVPFGLVVEALRPERVPGRNPLFQINLSLQPPGAALGGLTLDAVTAEPMPVSGGYARFDVALSVIDAPDGRVELTVEYSTELFDAGRIERLLDHFTAALSGGLAAPDDPATGIDVMPAAERHRVVRTWNDTATGYRAEPLHRLVETAAARTPDAVALVDHDGTHRTYSELDAAANRLAHRLRRHGVGPDVPVGVCLQRGADLVTALLATWKAGGAYLPLDPELPPERVTLLLADAAPPVVVTHAAQAQAFPTAIALDAERDTLAAEPTIALEDLCAADNAAYVLYTSGSTGVPKGVQVPHRGVHNRIAWMQDVYRLEPADRVLQKTPYGFDVSVWEFFWPLVTGATLVLAAPGGHRDPDYLYQLIGREGVTTLHFVPTMLRRFLDATAERGPLGSVRRVFCSGEALPADAVRRFLGGTWPGVELHNLYGPTEASIDVTAWRCEPDASIVPIGRPIANTRTYVLDGRLRPAPIGVPGQLFVAGVGLAHGYLNRPALTARSFLPDPYGDRPGERMYATGDLARWRPDGVLEYLGRIDRQVKLHGQRVELGEIEHALRQHPQIRHSAVVIRGNALAGYVVGDADLDEVRRFLAGRLPTYMIPTALVALPELPITPNGKLDTARLPDAAPPPAVEYAEPRTDTERWLADTWQDLLHVDRVGTGDTFFELGATSLHITQLTARIREHLGIHVHPRHLVSNPSLEHLARYLDESAGQPAETADPLVPLRATGTRPPLFLVHPVGGAVTHYVALAELLGEDQPVHAIEDPALHGVAPAGSLAERARRYVELIRRVQPHGPYHLGGWSLGGAVALEMAVQLADADESVALVVALDSGLPVPLRSPTDLETLSWFVVDVAGTAGAPLPEVDLDALGGLDRDTLEKLALDVLARAGLAPPDTHDDLRTRMRAFAANIAHYAGHRPRKYDGRLVLINATDNDATTDLSEWTARSPHLEHLTVPGDHYTMLRAPHVRRLAAAVRQCLDHSPPAGLRNEVERVGA